MNVGIVIGVSEYSGKPASLPACKKDADCVNSLLRETGKFDEVIFISDDTRSASVKGRLIEFINGNKGNEIEELFFYYSGHGEFSGDEFYYLLSDFESDRKKQTSLENSELDNLLRTLKPNLAIKIVDACQSGIAYIKDSDSFGKYLKGTQETFKYCYFLFSSLAEQTSYQDDNLSTFTRAFVEAIVNNVGPVIRYKDIIDYISDCFAKESGQTPFFVVQADFTDQFCRATDNLSQFLVKTLEGSTGLGGSGVSGITDVSLVELVKEEAKDYCTEEGIKEALRKLIPKVENLKPPQEARGLFDVELEIGSEYVSIGNIQPIAKWLNDKEHKYFAKPILKRQVVEVPGFFPTFYTVSEQKPKKQVINVPVGVRTTIEMPFTYIIVRGKPRFPNLQVVVCIVVPIVSKTHVRFFTAFSAYRDIGRGGDESIIDEGIKWRTVEVKLKDDIGIVDYLRTTFDEFWRFVLEPIKKKFGLLPSDESGVDSEAENAEENKTASDKKNN